MCNFIKFDIQLFASATSSNKKITSDAGNYAYIKAKFEEVADSVNIETNKNKVKVTATLTQKTGSWAQMYTPKLEIWWYDDNQNLGGIKVATTNVTALSSGNVKTATGTIEVQHNLDGTLNGYAEAKWIKSVSSDLVYDGDEISTSNTKLTTIPRKSTCNANSTFIGEQVTFTINAASNLFSHKIKWSYENDALSGEIDVPKPESGNVSYAFLELDDRFYELIPNAKEGTITYTCETYNDETLIGTDTTRTIKAIANEEDNKPIISNVSIIDTLNVGGTNTIIAANLSKPQVTMNVQGVNYAGIKSCKVTNGSQIVDAVVEDGVATAIFPQPITTEVTSIELINTRDYSTSMEVPSDLYTYVPYKLPKLNASVDRNTVTDGNLKINISGEFYNQNIGNVTQFLNITYRYKPKDGETWSSNKPLEFEQENGKIQSQEFIIDESNDTIFGEEEENRPFYYKKNWDFVVEYNDAFKSYLISFTIKKGEPTLWGNDTSININGILTVNKEDIDTIYTKKEVVGELEDLETTNKSSIVSAINSVNEKATKNIITARLESIYTLSTNDAYETLPLKKWQQLGNGFTMNDDGTVTIGTGINYIKLSGSCRFRSGAISNKYMTFTKNGSQIMQICTYKASTTGFTALTGSEGIIPVSEGDVIAFDVYGKSGDTIGASNSSYGQLTTYMTIEAIT